MPQMIGVIGLPIVLFKSLFSLTKLLNAATVCIFENALRQTLNQSVYNSGFCAVCYLLNYSTCSIM
jgi:hypothetical protein